MYYPQNEEDKLNKNKFRNIQLYRNIIILVSTLLSISLIINILMFLNFNYIRKAEYDDIVAMGTDTDSIVFNGYCYTRLASDYELTDEKLALLGRLTTGTLRDTITSQKEVFGLIDNPSRDFLLVSYNNISLPSDVYIREDIDLPSINADSIDKIEFIEIGTSDIVRTIIDKTEIDLIVATMAQQRIIGDSSVKIKAYFADYHLAYILGYINSVDILNF